MSGSNIATEEAAAGNKYLEFFAGLAGAYSGIKSAEANAEVAEWKAKLAAAQIQRAQPDYDSQDVPQGYVSAGFSPSVWDTKTVAIAAGVLGLAVYLIVR